MTHTLVICTSGKDRSPALAAYLAAAYPGHQYRTAGVNTYFTGKYGTHLLTLEDLIWAEKIIYCEQIHLDVAYRQHGAYAKPISTVDGHPRWDYIVLDCGQYIKDTPFADDYLMRADVKLKGWLK